MISSENFQRMYTLAIEMKRNSEIEGGALNFVGNSRQQWRSLCKRQITGINYCCYQLLHYLKCNALGKLYPATVERNSNRSSYM